MLRRKSGMKYVKDMLSIFFLGNMRRSIFIRRRKKESETNKVESEVEVRY